MHPRIENHFALAPAAIKAMMTLETAIAASGLDNTLIGLIKLRASQINGCAYCIHMHVEHLRQAGETEMRLHLLSAWREAPVYSERERAVLAWTEALTLLPQNGAADEDYAPIATQFSPEEQVNLTLAIGAINAWNRLQVGFRIRPVVSEGQHAA
ncbi:alkylhydroperoxidase [Devosia riboflavina]|uniref:Alkylhydroperoxidase n=1 Tax=Devosia riboflavina TaxID=46914 RepID=A0A087M7R0_9HYPH|nr:carboxymuconolactone decarboxylase family protein [Devosia riboflavina]KFL32913.1 alkylhydroperoxidase [Devosia riboflavina]